MIAYASGSGGVMFVPDEIERKEKKDEAILVVVRKANDNKQAPK